MFNLSFNYEHEYSKLSSISQQALEEKLSLRQYPKKYILIDANDVSNQVYFIKRGAVRSFYYDEPGNEITS